MLTSTLNRHDGLPTPASTLHATPAEAASTTAAPGAPIQHDTGRLRQLAHHAISVDRLEDAQLVLERALEQAPHDVELIGDIAALALRTGDAARALALSARGLEVEAAHLGCRFTQAFALAAAGQAEAARVALEALTRGPLGEALRSAQPALATLAAAELVRLENAARGGPATAGTPVHTLPLSARFDLLIKLLYVLHRRGELPGWVTVDVPALYRRHLLLCGFDAGIDRDASFDVDAGVRRFDALIDAIATRGFDPSTPVLISAADGLPVDGAHRLAAALALGVPVALRQVDAPGQRCDLAWLQHHGVDRASCDVLLHTWARLRGDAAVALLLWAPAEAHWPALEAALARATTIVEARTVALPRPGFEALVREAVAGAAGELANEGATEMADQLLRPQAPRLRVIYAERREGDEPGALEALVRTLQAGLEAARPGAGPGLHLSTTAAGTRQLMNLVAMAQTPAPDAQEPTPVPHPPAPAAASVAGAPLEALRQQFRQQEAAEREARVQALPRVRLAEKHMRNCQTVLDRATLLTRLPRWGTVAELGVDRGDFSAQILALAEPRRLHLVDTWGCERYHAGLHEAVQQRFAAELAEGRVQVHRKTSLDAAADFPDGHFDWLYLDTDHSYETTARELRRYAAKVKPNGLIAGHDYTMGNWASGYRYGVIEAVHEFCVEQHWELVFLTVDQTESPSFAIRRLL